MARYTPNIDALYFYQLRKKEADKAQQAAAEERMYQRLLEQGQMREAKEDKEFDRKLKLAELEAKVAGLRGKEAPKYETEQEQRVGSLGFETGEYEAEVQKVNRETAFIKMMTGIEQEKQKQAAIQQRFEKGESGKESRFQRGQRQEAEIAGMKHTLAVKTLEKKKTQELIKEIQNQIKMYKISGYQKSSQEILARATNDLLKAHEQWENNQISKTELDMARDMIRKQTEERMRSGMVQPESTLPQEPMEQTEPASDFDFLR